jgi:surfactin synthase thioesterase subunit
VHELQTRYGGIPQEILEHRELLALLLPTMRADLAMYERYRLGKSLHAPGDPAVGCPIDAFFGARDETTPREDMTAWSVHTRGALSLHDYDARHFFLASHERELRDAITQRLL